MNYRRRIFGAIIRSIPYGSSLLPGALLSRAIWRQSRLRSVAAMAIIVLYGLDPCVRRMMRFVRTHPHSEFSGQMLQDLWVLSTLGSKPGYFVDVGAAYPRKYSNSWALQNCFKWTGLLIEANPQFAHELRLSRLGNGVKIVEVAISLKSEVSVRLIDAGPMSSLVHTVHNDHLGRRRVAISSESTPVFVNTATLTSILESNNAPRHIDFLSIDIEGADFEALLTLDFAKYSVGMISVEHNFNCRVRDQIEKFLQDHGYEQVAPRFSSIDSWFIHNSGQLS